MLHLTTFLFINFFDIFSSIYIKYISFVAIILRKLFIFKELYKCREKIDRKCLILRINQHFNYYFKLGVVIK